MLKSSSLCLYSSNLGTFWLKIEQFWPFEEFLFLVMAAILDTGRRWLTQFWKGTTQGSFQQSLVEIGSVLSEEKIFLNAVELVHLLKIHEYLILKLSNWQSINSISLILSKFGSNWATHRFQTRRFLCEFPIGSYVKLSSAWSKGRTAGHIFGR